MKWILTITAILFAMSVQAKEIKITKFNVIRDSEISEICGKVLGDQPDSHDRVVLIADPDRNPGVKVVQPDPHGNFCELIYAYTKTAGFYYWNTKHHEKGKMSLINKTIK